MGMTIDTAITVLGMVEAHGVCIEAKDVAVDTMCKYQKIQQILKSLDDGEINYPQMAYYLREVLEDGNDD